MAVTGVSVQSPSWAPEATESLVDPAMAEWVVGVSWDKTVDREEAKCLKGLFANQHIACHLYHEGTVEFLKKEFAI